MDSNQRPPAPKAGALAWLSYTLCVEKLALRREIESLSPERQSGRLTRCVTERVVRLGRLERPLNALSTHSLCRLGYRRDWSPLRETMSLPPNARSAVAVSCTCGARAPETAAAYRDEVASIHRQGRFACREFTRNICRRRNIFIALRSSIRSCSQHGK